MRGNDEIDFARVADLLHKLNHALASGWVKPIGGFVEDEQMRSVDNRHSKFRHLLHAERIAAEFPVSSFTQAHIKEGFMSTFHRSFRRKTRELGHHSDEAYGR